MVALTAVKASNALLASSLPNLVAVFVGGTSGIGEFTLKAFAQHTLEPRAYLIGRSQEAGDRIKAECQKLNPTGEFIFMKADTSLIRNVDKVCEEIKAKETKINILFLTTGTLAMRVTTEEKLLTAMSLAYYSRTRFMLNLLPLLQSAPSLRRVVTVFCGSKEGPINANDFGGFNAPIFPPLAARGHSASLVTLGLEAVERQAPTVSFMHVFPGAVKTNIGRDMKGLIFFVLSGVFSVLSRWVCVKPEEVGERHLFCATSSMYAPEDGEEVGLKLVDGVKAAKETNGKVGSGVYSTQQDCESAGPEVDRLLAGFRKEGLVEKVWAHTEDEYERILG